MGWFWVVGIAGALLVVAFTARRRCSRRGSSLLDKPAAAPGRRSWAAAVGFDYGNSHSGHSHHGGGDGGGGWGGGWGGDGGGGGGGDGGGGGC
jgi:hypothetical protein